MLRRLDGARHRRPTLGAGYATLPRIHQSRAIKLLLTAGNPDHPSEGQCTRLYWPGMSQCLSQVGRSRPQPWIRTRPNPVSHPRETNRRMSSDMSVALSGMPDGTASNAKVANACVPAGERLNMTPIFISCFFNTRSFLAWLRAFCPGSLMTEIKGEKLMVVQSTADGFRVAVSALRSLDGKDGVNFHTFTLAEDRCARLQVKNLSRGMPQSVVRKELESLSSYDSAVAIRMPPRTALPHTHHCVKGARAWVVRSAIAHWDLRLASVGGVVCGSKKHAALQALPLQLQSA